jgi:hypothetical protein
MTAHIGAASLAARTWEAASRLSPAADDRSVGSGWPAAPSSTPGCRGGRRHARARRGTSPTALDDIIERHHGAAAAVPPPARRRRVHRRRSMLRAAAARGRGSRSSTSPPTCSSTPSQRYIDEGGIGDIIATRSEAVALRGRVDDERARRIDIVEARRCRRRATARRALLDRYRRSVVRSAPAEDASFLAGVVAPRSASSAARPPPTSCSTRSRPTCGRAARSVA